MSSNNRVSSSQYAESLFPYSLAQKEDEKKAEQERIAHLLTLLKSLETDLTKAKGQATDGAQAPSNSDMEQGLADLALILQMLQVNITQYGTQKAQFDNEIAQALVNQAKDNLQKVEAALKQIQEEQDKENTASTIGKIFGYIIGALAVVAAVVLAQPELLVVAAISFASAAGLISKATDGVATLLQSLGMSAELAKIVASVLVTVLVIAATLAVPVSAAADVAEGAEAAADTAEGAEAAEGGATASKTVLQQIGEAIYKVNPFARLSTRANLVISTGAITAAQSNLIPNIIDPIVEATHSSPEDKKKIEAILSAIFGVLLAVVSMAAGGTALLQAEGTTTELGLTISNSLARFGISATRIAALERYVSEFSMAGQVVAGLVRSGYEISQGRLTKVLYDLEANLQLIGVGSQMSTQETKEDQTHLVDALKQERTSNQSISELMQGMAGFANLFTAHSPV